MASCYVVTEGLADSLLITEILKTEFVVSEEGVKVIPGGGWAEAWSNADSLARSLLVARHVPVALLVDADTQNPVERQQFLEFLFARYAPLERWKVLVAAPELLSFLFLSRDVIRSLTGKEPTETQMIRGEYKPKEILNELLDGRHLPNVMRDKLPTTDLSVIRDASLIKELREFVTQFAESKRSINTFAQAPGGALPSTVSTTPLAHRDWAASVPEEDE
jgi:hypothetical protein